MAIIGCVMNIVDSGPRTLATIHRDRLLQLYRRPKFGKRVGNHRMTRWIDRLRDRFPSTWPPVIGVVGSNGKGSTAAMVHSILSQVLHNVGRYTSPHFFDFRERIRVGSADVTDSELGLALDWLDRQMKSAADDKDSDPTTAFECFTVLALFVFLHAQVDTIVAEAGMGGRLDPTGCLHPAAVAFSSVDLEHTEVLGVTLEQIALEKAAIAHPGATLWLGAMPKDIVDVVRSFCAFSQVIVRQAPFCDKPVLGDSGQKMEGASDTVQRGLVRRLFAAR